MAKRGFGKRNRRLADMSLPPEERNPGKSTRTSREPKPAQLQHGNSRWGRARRRDGERLMERERSDAAPVVAEPEAELPGGDGPAGLAADAGAAVAE